MSGNGNWGSYDDFIAAADRDNREGDQDFMVSQVTSGKWSDLKPDLSDDPYFKVAGVLLTANNASIDFTWSPPPPADVLKAELATMPMEKQKALATAIRIGKALAENYGKSVETLKQGDVFRVKVVKTKKGYARVVAVLPAGELGKTAASRPDASQIPF